MSRAEEAHLQVACMWCVCGLYGRCGSDLSALSGRLPQSRAEPKHTELPPRYPTACTCLPSTAAGTLRPARQLGTRLEPALRGVTK